MEGLVRHRACRSWESPIGLRTSFRARRCSRCDGRRMRRRRKLWRVVLDSALRMPLDSKMVKSADDDVVVFTVSKDTGKIGELEKRGVRVEALPAEAGRGPLGKVLDKLGAEGILTVITETG